MPRILRIIAVRSRGRYRKRMTDQPFSVLFVCTGNICRSPTADAVLRHKVREAGLDHLIRVDSAGTHGYHIGHAPDPRAIETALVRGKVDMHDLRARQVSVQDFNEFDWIIAMDEGHHAALDRLAISGGRGKVLRFLSFRGDAGGDVPDPYYGGQQGFDRVYDMVEAGCAAILARIQADFGQKS
jgi:protein-tyrosine phosphatase